MKKRFFIIPQFSLLIGTLLTACSGRSSVTPPVTPEPLATAMLTQIPAAGLLTPISPYQIKQVTVAYTDSTSDSVFDMLFVPSTGSKLVLYTDGQLIITDTPYQQKLLTPEEVSYFMSKLESLGYYRLETNGRHDPTDRLYNFGDGYHGSDYGFWHCIFVQGDYPSHICAYEPFLEYLVPEMKNILQFLDEYHPAGMFTYYPDRILLWIERGRNPHNRALSKKAIPWPESFPTLEGANRKLMQVEGDGAKQVSTLFGNTDSSNVFIQNGVEYTVYIRIVLPHEELRNWFQ